MTAKEYLQQIYFMNRKIKRLEDRHEQIRSDLYSIGSPSGKMDADKVQTSLSGDTMLRLIAKVDKVERDILYEMSALLDAKDRIVNQIESMKNEKHKDVLFKRYVMFERWEQIAVDMDISLRYVYKLHGSALKEFTKIME